MEPTVEKQYINGGVALVVSDGWKNGHRVNPKAHYTEEHAERDLRERIYRASLAHENQN